MAAIDPPIVHGGSWTSLELFLAEVHAAGQRRLIGSSVVRGDVRLPRLAGTKRSTEADRHATRLTVGLAIWPPFPATKWPACDLIELSISMII